jgi:hypothetical protein
MNSTEKPGPDDYTCPFCRGTGMLKLDVSFDGKTTQKIEKPCLSCSHGVMHPEYYKRVYEGKIV